MPLFFSRHEPSEHCGWLEDIGLGLERPFCALHESLVGDGSRLLVQLVTKAEATAVFRQLGSVR